MQNYFDDPNDPARPAGDEEPIVGDPSTSDPREPESVEPPSDGDGGQDPGRG